MNKIIGIGILVVLFGGIFTLMAVEAGSIIAIKTLVITLIILGLTFGAVHFLTKETKSGP